MSVSNRKTQQGSRDYILLMFLYDSANNASEVANLTINDLEIDCPRQVPHVTIHGKGNKTRICPLWDNTVQLLIPYIDRPKKESVFLNRFGEALTRFSIYEMITRHVEKASYTMRSINPHCSNISKTSC